MRAGREPGVLMNHRCESCGETKDSLEMWLVNPAFMNSSGICNACEYARVLAQCRAAIKEAQAAINPRARLAGNRARQKPPGIGGLDG